MNHFRRAKPTKSADGVMRASSGEADFVSRLLLRERAGEISALELQPSYRIEINGQFVCNVKADARYIEGRLRVIDYKGFRGDTPISKLKRRLVFAVYGVVIETVGPGAKKSPGHPKTRPQVRRSRPAKTVAVAPRLGPK